MRFKQIKYRKILVTDHAVLRAQTRHYDIYLKHRKHGRQKVRSWLRNVVVELATANRLLEGVNEIDHLGALWPIVVESHQIVLKTISIKKGKRRRQKPLSRNQCRKLKDKKRRQDDEN